MYYKKNVLLKLLEVIVYIHVVSKSTKVPLVKLRGFLHMLFLEKEAQIK